MDELSGGFAEPLSYAHREGHICHSCRPKVRQPARFATNFLCKRGPSEAEFLTSLGERGIQLVQIPPESARGPWIQKAAVTHIDDGPDKEFFRRPIKPARTTAQLQALAAAKGYLTSGMGFSQVSLIAQLTSDYGNGFSQADAQWAAAHSDADWNAQAATAAKR